jgi:hypothetical protein
MATKEQLEQALINAHAAGDTNAARILAAEIRRMEQPTGKERALDLAKAALGGLVRGAAGVAALPSLAGELLDVGYEKIGLIPEGSAAAQRERNPLSTQNIGRATSFVSGGLSEYQPTTTLGKYAGTAAEFGVGGGLLGGAKAVPAALISGVGSEAGGQLAERFFPDSTYAETIGRVGGAIVAPAAAGRLVQPAGAIDPIALKQAKTVEDALGVKLTAGEATASRGLRALEGATTATEEQLDAYTKYVMRAIGSDADRATAEAIDASRKRIGAEFDAAAKGIDVTPATATSGGQPAALHLGAIASRYERTAPSSEVVGEIRRFANWFNEAAQGGRKISSDELLDWRSYLSDITASASSQTQKAAVDALEVLDNVIEQSLTAAGKTDELARLITARQQYRDYLAVEKAAGGGAIERGILTPAAMEGAMKGQGYGSYVRGGRGELGAVTQATADVLKPLPAVLPAGVRAIQGGATLGGGAAGYALGGPAAAVFGAAMPTAVQQGILSAPMQAYLRQYNPRLYGSMQALTPTQRSLLAVNQQQGPSAQ